MLRIIELCLKWYHIAVFFEFYEESRVEIMDDDTAPTVINYKMSDGKDYTSCYGSTVMPSIDPEIYEYHVKLGAFAGVAIYKN